MKFPLLCLAAAPIVLGAADAPLPTALDAGWHGARVCEMLFDNAEMRAMRCTFPPGVGHERHFHPRHWGYIEQGGTMRITTASGTAERVLASATRRRSISSSSRRTGFRADRLGAIEHRLE